MQITVTKALCCLCATATFPAQRAPAASIMMKGKQSANINEFSRMIGVASLGRRATRNMIEASDAECEALATRFDLVSIGSLAANVSCAIVDPRRSRVRTYGSFTAMDVVQRGMINGDQTTTLQLENSKFETFFIDEELANDAGIGAFDSDEDESYDEYIEDGQLDMGELVAQHLYLAISDRQQLELKEFSTDPALDGTIVLDTDPDLP